MQDTSINERLLDKIRALMKMSADPSENEAAIASNKLNELLLKHSISLTEIDLEDNPLGKNVVVSLRQKTTWKGSLITAIAKANLCRAYWDWDGDSNVMIVAGRESNRVAVKYLYEYLVEACERLYKESRKAYKDTYGVSPRDNFKKDFCRGFSARAAARLREQTQAAQTEGIPSEGISALAVVNAHDSAQSEISRFLNDSGVRLNNRRASSARVGAGYEFGKNAANTVGLNTQVGASVGQRALPGIR